MNRFVFLFLAALLAGAPGQTVAQTLNASEHRIQWQVVNRFRFFQDAASFKLHESAWRQYLIHVDGLGLEDDERSAFVQRTATLGGEHVLNDRRIAFTDILRENFNWQGWAAAIDGKTCYDPDSRRHSACGGTDPYLLPERHAIEVWLEGPSGVSLRKGLVCEWRIAGELVAEADCARRITGANVALPYPEGAEISVNVRDEGGISVDARTKDILIAGFGDSFASGEGNPNRPVAFSETRRHRNLYPRRAENSEAGSARWSDRLCHRSLYGQHLRAALQIAVENPQLSVTFLDYSCSGAGVDEGILGPQTYVERMAGSQAGTARTGVVSGGSRDSQIYRILRELCAKEPKEKGGYVVCPDRRFKRHLDFLFLSIGGNDIGFSNVVAWASLRDGASSSIASFFGATVDAKDFAQRMKDVLPGAYARLAKAFEEALPLYSEGEAVFDPGRVILTSYPDLVSNERGGVCEGAGGESDIEDLYPANQSLDMFSSWLAADRGRLVAVQKQFANLHSVMASLAGDHGWSFAGASYADRFFEGHGFCARNEKHPGDPAEQLMIPCWGEAERDTQSCESSWTGEVLNWRPYNPATQNYPYALRQRWVRTFNDAYMVVNQKVTDRDGRIDEETSAGVFSETTGALHPTAEGHAAMADALLLAVRPMIRQLLPE